MWQQKKMTEHIKTLYSIKTKLDPTSLNVDRWAHFSTVHNLFEQCCNVCFWELLIDWWSWTKIGIFAYCDVISWRNLKCSQPFYLSVSSAFNSATSVTASPCHTFAYFKAIFTIEVKLTGIWHSRATRRQGERGWLRRVWADQLEQTGYSGGAALKRQVLKPGQYEKTNVWALQQVNLF